MEFHPIKRIKSIFSGSDTHRHEIIRGTSTAFLLKVGGLFFSYLFNLYMARVYGASVIGTFALSVTIASIFVLFGQMGTRTSIIRFIAGHAAQNNGAAIRLILARTLSLLVPSSLVAGMSLWAFGNYVAPALFTDATLRPAFMIIAIAVPFLVIAGVNASALRGLKRIRASYLFQATFTPLSNLLLLLVLTTVFATYYLLPIWAYCITAALSMAFSALVLKRALPPRANIGAPAESRVAIWRASMPMMMSSAMLLILGWTDIVMLGIFTNTNEVGLYRIAQRLSILTSFSLVAVNSIMAPKFSELYSQADLEGLKRLAQFAARLIFWTSLPVLLALLILAKPILGIFGPDFEIAAYALMALCAGQFINAGCGSVGFLLDMTGNQVSFRNVLISAAILNITLNALLIPRFGILGAGLATAVSTAAWNLGASFSVYNLFGFWIGYKPKFLES